MNQLVSECQPDPSSSFSFSPRTHTRIHTSNNKLTFTPLRSPHIHYQSRMAQGGIDSFVHERTGAPEQMTEVIFREAGSVTGRTVKQKREKGTHSILSR